MPANTDPVFTASGNAASDAGTGMGTAITGASGDYTGAGANNTIVFTAGANGSYLKSLSFNALGTNVATVARVYINNGSANTTATNNVMFDQLSLPATTATNTAATAKPEMPFGFKLKAGWRIVVGLGTAVAAGWRVCPIAEDF